MINEQTYKIPVFTIHNLDVVDYDIIIFDESFYSELINSRYRFREDMLILVTCSLDLWLYDKVNNVFPNAVMAVYSDIQCRKLTSDTFQVIKNGYKVIFGVLSRGHIKSQLLTVSNFNQKGVVFSDLKRVMKCHNNMLIVLSPASFQFFRKLVWKSIIKTVCFHCLSIIFEDYDYLKLTQMPDSLPILKGSFNEILALISVSDTTDFPLPQTDECVKLLQIMTLTETNLSLSLKSLHHTKPFLDANVRYYNFTNGFELGISPLLSKLLSDCQENGLTTPFLQSISYLIRVMRQREVSPMLRRKSLTKKTTVNGITPENNMMNFPPFNPLPLPNPVLKSYPLIMMVKQESDNESIVSIDPLVKEVYEETFYDSREGGSQPGNMQSSGSTLHQPSVSSTVAQHAIAPVPALPHTNLNYVPQQANIPFSGPLAPTLPIQYSSVPMPQTAMPFTKLPKYHHLPYLDKSSSAKLKEYHDKVMESVRYNPLESPSRYGKYDTSMVLSKKK
ncbi:hypothetical protein CLIB1444_19S01112 [[Candida] jaroonii]|uniref:Uncharacterized protein n=1 Tax=[Candida] jaroonii TaxID=467808 RepID=A0ACA9YF86_9ASCO|nr:hypothetical protein CLIB1444_19S01112 [[Candida] jaroonii]